MLYTQLSLAFGALSMSKKLRMQFPNKFFLLILLLKRECTELKLLTI